MQYFFQTSFRLLIPVLLLVAVALQSQQPTRQKLVDARGTVKQVSADRFGIVPDSNPRQVLAPDSLPVEFRKDKLRVLFSGEVGEIPANVRMWGTPFKLSTIKRL